MNNHGGTDEQAIQESDEIKAEGILVEAVGVGAREAVNEALLMRIVSVVNGRPLYRWIGNDGEELVRHYRSLALRDV